MTTVGEPTASNRDLNSSSERDLNNSSERTWTSATTETLGNVLQAAQDLVYKVEEGVSNNLGAAAETAKEYAISAKDQVVDAGSKVSQTLTRVLSAGSLKSSPSSEDFEVNAGEPQPSPSLQSPDLRPTQKRARIYISPSPSMSMDSLDMPPPTGLEANLDTALCGPQRLANASVS
eukprot:TRINITY_DN3383_c0_g1_i2.p1 TRINITY_DN3383_c0_g1~~TRINITY_DN3383_c0_g1_i2.p1  ORF type:complete len:176 (+),score=47.03 TRINITY_DN3383_c0_g1_i2:95-622(+)